MSFYRYYKVLIFWMHS